MFRTEEKWLVFRRAENFTLLDCVLQSTPLCNRAYEPFKNLRKKLVPLCWKTECRSWGRAEEFWLWDLWRHQISFGKTGIDNLKGNCGSLCNKIDRICGFFLIVKGQSNN